MKTFGIAAALAVLALVALGAGYIHYHNRLVALDVAVDAQWKQVENQLARQHELLPKLATVARKYVEHEEGVLSALFASREHYASAEGRNERRLASEVDGVVVQALALAERYPQLKADGQYRDLAYEIAGTKNRIAVERRRYNELVGELNTRLQQLPWKLCAGDLAARDFLETDEAKLVEPELAL